MSAWIWFVIAAVMLVIEAATVSLVSIWFALGAAAAGVANLCGANLAVQIIICLVVSVALIILVVPRAKNTLFKIQPTNSDRIIGQSAVVIEKIDLTEGSGQIKVMGAVWSAKSDKVIEIGETVTVTAIEGVKAVVERAQ